MSYCSRSHRRRFTALDFKSWAISRICGHCQQHLYCACAKNGYLWTSGVNLDTSVRFADPDFLIECKITSILLLFPLIFFYIICWSPAYFYFRFVWPTNLESIPHALTRTWIIPTKFEVDMTIHYRVIAFLPSEISICANFKWLQKTKRSTRNNHVLEKVAKSM